MKGTIIRSTGSWYDIEGEGGEIYKGRLRGKFRVKDLKVTNPVAVGDHIVFEKETEETVVITNILSRENYIIRKSTHKAAHAHLIAANIDQAILMATLFYPRTSLGFIDRFLVSAEAFRIPAVIVLNKTDLVNRKEKKKELEEITGIYENIGYKVLLTSVVSGEGLEEFKKILSSKTSLLSGHSGVGKSTLLNKVYKLDLKTGNVSDFAEKGKHTTTFAEMFRLGQETKVIDTPGIKELGISDMESWEISHYFPEMRALLGECKFNNCLHVNEPGCAVKAKLEKEEIAVSRYENYLSILEEEDQYR